MGTLTSAETSLAESKLQRKQESVPKDSLTWGGVLGTSAAQHPAPRQTSSAWRWPHSVWGIRVAVTNTEKTGVM